MAGMEAIAEAIGVSLPVLQFLMCFFITIPCSSLRRFIKGTSIRHAYSALTGAVLSYHSFGTASNILFVLPIFGSYASMVFYRKKAGFITAFIAFTYLIGWYDLFLCLMMIHFLVFCAFMLSCMCFNRGTGMTRATVNWSRSKNFTIFPCLTLILV